MQEEARAWGTCRLMHVSFGLTPLQTLISSQKEMSGNQFTEERFALHLSLALKADTGNS